MTTDSELIALSAFAYTSPSTKTKGVTQGGESDGQHIDPASLGWEEVALRDVNWHNAGVNVDNPLLLMLSFGMSAHILTKGNEVVIDYRGTDSDSTLSFFKDALTDFGLGTGTIGLQIFAAYWFYQAAMQVPGMAGKTVTFVGHSLGGALASIMADYTGQRAVVINPAPDVSIATAVRSGVFAGVSPWDAVKNLLDATEAGLAQKVLGEVGLVLDLLPDMIKGISWPGIPAAPAGAPHGTITRYVNSGDPLTEYASWSGGGMLGNTTTIDYSYDPQYFDFDFVLSNLSLTDTIFDLFAKGISANKTYLHSPYLGAFFQAQAERGTNLLPLTHQLPDLLSAMFNPDVAMIKLLTVAGALKAGEQPRYDLLFKVLTQAELVSRYSGNLSRRQWVNAFLTDLNAIAVAHSASSPGKDQVEMALTELSVQYTARQASGFVRNTSYDSTSLFILGGTTGDSPDVLYADLSRILPADPLSASTLDGENLKVYGIERLGKFLNVETDSTKPFKLKISNSLAGMPSTLTGLNGEFDSSGRIINAGEILLGSSGNDRFTGSRGDDWILGEGGTDTLDYTGYFSGIKMTRTGSGATIIDGVNYTDHVRDVEKIIGTSYSDELSATGSGETHLWGGGGPDKFNLSNKTFVQDADKSDKTYMYGIRLSGGVAQWWSDSGWAYWAPVSSLMMPATMGHSGRAGAVG